MPPNMIIYFNSTLVRLKDGTVIVAEDGMVNFNSTLVRLKDPFEQGNKGRGLISIPHWCD